MGDVEPIPREQGARGSRGQEAAEFRPPFLYYAFQCAEAHGGREVPSRRLAAMGVIMSTRRRRIWSWSWSFAALVLVSACKDSQGGAPPDEPSRRPVPSVDWRVSVEGNSLNGLTRNPAGWVAVGSGGMVLTSPDGISWTNRATPSRTSLNGIAWSGTRFVAVGGDRIWGTGGTILTSTDGVEWTSQDYSASTLESVVWSGSQFVAVGWNGVIVTSPDGLHWTFRDSRATTFLLAVTWSGSKFVAVGWTVLTSPDGVTWTEQRAGVPDVISLRCVTWTGTQFVAAGYGGRILTSPDAVTWTSTSIDPHATFTGIAWSATGLVVVGDMVFTSPDGVEWTMRIGASPPLRAVAWSGSEYVAVGHYGSIKSSSDGVTWDWRVAPATNTLRGVAWSGSTFVAVGDWGTILTSPDGESWTSRPSGTRQWLSSVIWTGVEFVAVGAGWDGLNQTTPLVLSSPDGVEWSTLTVAGAYSLTGVARVEALSAFVAVGGYGTLATSPDGTAWTLRTGISGLNCGLEDVAGFGTQVVSVGWCNTIVRSDDGIAWTAHGGGEVGDAFFGVAASPTGFVVVGDGPGTPVLTLTSVDGVTWTRRVPQLYDTLNAIEWIGGQFIAVGRSGSIATSPDGVLWTARYGPSRGELYAVTGDADRLVAVGYQGLIETSP